MKRFVQALSALALVLAIGTTARAQQVPRAIGLRLFPQSGAPFATGETGLWVDQSGPTLKLRAAGGADTAFGSLGNFTFSGNSEDLVAAGTMLIAPTTATNLTLGRQPNLFFTTMVQGDSVAINAGASGSIQMQIGAGSTTWEFNPLGAAGLRPAGDLNSPLGDITHRINGAYTNAVFSGASQLLVQSTIANGATPAIKWNTTNTFSGNIAYQWTNNGTHLLGIYPSGTTTYFGFNSAVTQYLAFDSTNNRILFFATNGFAPATDNTTSIGTTSLRATEVDSLAFKSGASTLTVLSGLADGASAQAIVLGSSTQINASGSGGKLVSFQSNNGTEVASIKPFFGSANNQGIQLLGETSNTFLQLSNANGSKYAYGTYYLGAQVNLTGFNFHFTSGDVVDIDSGAIFPGTDATLTSLGKKANRYNGVFNAGSDSCNFNAQSGTTYTTVAGDCQIAISNAAAKTVTLATAATYPAGAHILIIDGSQNANTQNISVARSGSDTINGGTANVAVVTVAADHSTCVTDGSTKWLCGINN